jgi:hypothetical protein
MKNSQLIVVLGMHRSGTSAITRGLEVLGVNLGNNLYPAEIDNPKGFWEDNEFLAINEQLLASIGSTSDQLGLMNWKTLMQPNIEPIRLRAENLVREKCVKNSIWAFKDPRTARLLDFWQAVFEAVDCDVHYIISSRNPMSIVESLRKRNGYDSEKVFYLWLEHMISAMLATKGEKRIVVSYDRLLDDPDLELSRLARSFELPDPEISALAIYGKEFLDGALRHTVFSARDLKHHPNVPSQAIIAFDWLERLADDTMQSDISAMEEVFDVLRRELVALPAYWENSIADHLNSLKALTQIVEQRDETIQAQDGIIEQRDETIQALDGIIEQRDETIQAQDGIIEQRDETIQALDGIIEQRDETIQAQIKLIDNGVAALRELNQNRLVKALKLVKLIK